jgi:hypothetical protein
LSEDDRQTERLLASLVPRESRVNRDRLMFLAGQASVESSRQFRARRPARWIWPAVTLCSTCAGLLIGVSLSPGQRGVGDPVAAMPRTVVHLATSDPSQTVLPANALTTQAVPKTATLDSADAPAEGPIDLFSGRAFPLLVLRDRMLASRGDELDSEQLDLPSPHDGSLQDGSAAEPERPLSARKLLQRWIADESLKRR